MKLSNESYWIEWNVQGKERSGIKTPLSKPLIPYHYTVNTEVFIKNIWMNRIQIAIGNMLKLPGWLESLI